MATDRAAPVDSPHSTDLVGGWLGTFRRYFFFIVPAHLIWETLQLPLYTIWQDGSAAEIAFAVMHCTAGDLLIAFICLVGALMMAGHNDWPSTRFWRVLVIAMILGVGYTVFSEWLNLVVRESWAYSDLMPIIPPFGTGLSPLMQWISIPIIGLWWARSAKIPGVRALFGRPARSSRLI